MILAAASTVFFLLLHGAVSFGARGQPFHVQLKLSRGFATIILTAIGFYSMWQWWDLWPQAFLRRHEPGSEPYLLITFVTGHFIADVGLLLWGWLRRESLPRIDLIAHHALGVAVCLVVFHYEVGHLLFAVALTTEMMPVTSGIAAFAPLLGRPALERIACELRLAVLLLWRLPFWTVIVVIVLLHLLQGESDSLIILAQRITLAAMAIIIALDTYWVRLCLKGLREPLPSP
jgi:hypothetical protein